ncbi:YcnI family protein [Streptomyces sp. TR02-1]|uniref:YcnI family copper-binding membrane protein n=1 Tax=Streptomyces sp. TR02-1 TaxID=3385977 RepID=UPI0039A25EE3
MTTAHTTRPATRRLAVSAALAAATVLTCAGAASAHVGVDPGEAEKGGYSTVTFKVPNERDDASTVKLEVNLPANHPIGSAMPQPVPGWDIDVTTSTLDEPIEQHGSTLEKAVTRITWSGGTIEPGRFQQFPVSMGPLPEDTDRLAFKALQRYDSGEVVRWIEVPEEGAAEPEHPAPVLELTAAEGEGHHSGGTAGDATHAPGAGAAEAGAPDHDDAHDAAADATDSTARALGVVGILVGAAGVAFGVLARRRRT